MDTYNTIKDYMLNWKTISLRWFKQFYVNTFLISHLCGKNLFWNDLLVIMCLAAIIWAGKYQHQKFILSNIAVKTQLQIKNF